MAENERAARIRVLHTSPDAPAIDVAIDDCTTLNALSYSDVTDYVEISPERHEIQVLMAGQHDPADVLASLRTLKLRPDQAYSLAVVGELQNLREILFEDSLKAPVPGQRKARLRLFHASVDAPALDLAIDGGPTLFEEVGFTLVTPYIELDAGTKDLQLRRTHHDEVLATLHGYPLSGDGVYSLIALGRLEGQPAFTIMPIVELVGRYMPV
jgi:hypothetical protein